MAKKRNHTDNEVVPTNDEIKTELYNAMAEIGLNIPTLLGGATSPLTAGLSLASGYKIARESARILDYFSKIRKAKKAKLISSEQINSDLHKDLLDEYLHVLETEPVNAKEMEFLQSILFASLSEDLNSDESTAILYFDIAKNFSNGEMILLSEVYKIAQSQPSKEQLATFNSAHGWLKNIAEFTVLKHPHLVELNELLLIEKGMLTPRTYSDRSGVNLGGNLRLTSFAIEFLEFIRKGQEVMNSI